MTFEQIISDLKKKVYHPVYFLTGEEPYFIDAISDYVENTVLNDMEKEFNQTIVYGGDIDVSAITSVAKRFPMMSNYQVVIVKEAQNIKNLVGKEKEEKSKSAPKHPLEAYIENPQKSTLLVICYKYKSVDKRTNIGKLISKNTVFFDSKKLYDNQVPAWIESYLKGKAYTMHPLASEMLTEYLGADLSKIVNELDKLMINLPARSEITVDHIQSNIGVSKDYNTFELQAALGKKDVLKANKIVNYFSSNPKDYPLVVTVISLFSYFSKILMYHYLPDKSKNSAAAALGVHPFFMGDYERASRNFGVGKLKTIISDLREYDLKSKGFDNGTADPRELLKELVFKIIH